MKQEIIIEIKTHIQQCGGKYSNWNVGITSNPTQRLFNDHNVAEKNGSWIYRKCETSTIAREVEEYFIDSLGTDGGSGGGDYTTKFVYAYEKTSYTKE